MSFAETRVTLACTEGVHYACFAEACICVCHGPRTQTNEKETNMSIEIGTFVRRPFDVQAVQITAENMALAALWCGGYIVTDETPGLVYSERKKHIKVKVNRPLYERQTQAFIGDWVLKSEKNNGFRVYTDSAFQKTFQKRNSDMDGFIQE